MTCSKIIGSPLHSSSEQCTWCGQGAWMVVGWLQAAPAAHRVVSSHVCDDVCSGGASCDAECWESQFDYDQNYPSTTCGDQGYACCGDGWCDSAAEGCNVCPDDCGYQSTCGSGCTSTSQCSSGEVRLPSHVCAPYTPPQDAPHTPACGGSCSDNSQCCGSDVCIGDPGQKYCGIPEQTYCPDAPACSGYLFGSVRLELRFQPSTANTMRPMPIAIQGLIDACSTREDTAA